MTDYEKRQQRAEAAIKVKDVRENLNHLRVKARTVADDLRAVAAWITKQSDIRPSGADFNPTIEAVRVNAKYQAAMNFNDLLRLDDDLKAARQDVVNAETNERMLEEGRNGTIRF